MAQRIPLVLDDACEPSELQPSDTLKFAIRKVNIPITSAMIIAGGWVDATAGGYTFVADDEGDWLFWWETTWTGANTNSRLELGVSINNPAAPSADTIRLSEVDGTGDPLTMLSTAFFSGIVAGSTVFGSAQDVGANVVTLENRRLMGIKVD